MHEYLPVLIVGAVIGVFAVVFLTAFLLEKEYVLHYARNGSAQHWKRNFADVGSFRRSTPEPSALAQREFAHNNVERTSSRKGAVVDDVLPYPA